MGAMGTTTRAQFFRGGESGNTVSLKPIELLKSKTKGNSLLQQLWFERAEKTMKHLNHFELLMDQFEYMGDLANRLSTDSLPSLKKSLKDEKNDKLRRQKQQLVLEMKSFLELYQTYNIKDYDYWDHNHSPMFSLFVDKFEQQGQSLEIRCSQSILGVTIEGEEEGKFFTRNF